MLLAFNDLPPLTFTNKNADKDKTNKQQITIPKNVFVTAKKHAEVMPKHRLTAINKNNLKLRILKGIVNNFIYGKNFKLFDKKSQTNQLL